jgi:hypothetical protein
MPTCPKRANSARAGDVTTATENGVVTKTRRGARAALLVTQGALSVLLLVMAGLFVRSLRNTHRLHLGYDVAPVLTVYLSTRDVTLDSAGAVRLRAAPWVCGCTKVPYPLRDGRAHVTPRHVGLGASRRTVPSSAQSSASTGEPTVTTNEKDGDHE